jgi:hypothetical protein
MTPARCSHCPVARELCCPGADAARLCELVDPGLPAYRPGYVAAIRGHALRMAEAAANRIVAGALAEVPAAIPPRGGCCGS